MPFRKLSVILLLCTAVPFFSAAQYIIQTPSYREKESRDISLRAVRLYPDSLILDLTYTGSYAYSDPGFYINATSHIEFSYGGTRLHANWSSKVSKLINAYYTEITHVKKGATHNFSVVFPFSIYNLFGDKNISLTKAEEFFSAPDPLAISFINCDKNYRSSYNLSYGTCFDIYKINLQMSEQSWAALWCKGFLKKHYEKDEFETTVKYRERIAAANTRLAVKAEIKKVYNLFAHSYLSKIADEVPQIKYDSDTETFSMKYSGAEEMSIAMPINVARTFKQSIVDKSNAIDDIEVVTYPSGNHYISAITYKDRSGKKTKVENKLNTSTSAFSSVSDNILAKLRETYPDL